ncbi:ABC transporter permease [Prosthecochloris sp. CIB 2401]|uniref:ABC transporter permease n=1 Tax=Prosthecochloris sp. CIB 2401 TaxID=1868325 RepID=UPI00080AC01E|nr:FtsX-like permease family protein [Prosthecochloris sp. CIB 2401]ANT64887.1 Lipoprotein-releasing system transmembrane protein LolE [Prosthecochloris sp. CIB 2401]
MIKPGLWIARRFSFARKRFRIINIISAVSLAGIFVGVATIIVVLSVLNGFQELARDLFLQVESPLQIVSRDGKTMPLDRELLIEIEALPDVLIADPFMEGEAVLAAPGMPGELVTVKGISARAEESLMRRTGEPYRYFGPTTISVGDMLAYRAGIRVPQEVRLFSPELISLGLSSLSQPWVLPGLSFPVVRVESIFSLQRVFNDHYVLASLPLASEILLMKEGECSGIDIRSDRETRHASRVLKARIEELIMQQGLDKTLTVRLLEDKYTDVFAVMIVEKWVSFSVLMLVVLVASLSLTGSLTMTAIDKKKELFYLRCLGMERPQFLTIFIVQGVMIGVVGSLGGAGVAWALTTLQERFGIVQLPSKTAFIIDAYPVELLWSDVALTCLITIGLSFLVSLSPAFKAAALGKAETTGE